MKFLFTILILSILFNFTSCEVFKTRHSARTDSVAVNKVDSSRLTKTDAGNRSDSSWWREIINFLPKPISGHDTVINNTTVPVNNYYPAQIIREGGTISKEDWLRMMDSVNKSKVDSTHITASVDDKTKTVKILGFWQIVAIAGGVGLIFFLIGKLKIGFK